MLMGKKDDAVTKSLYRESVENIKNLLVDAAVDFCVIGYYLKMIRDQKYYEIDGYKDIWEMAAEVFGFSKSTASRHMTMNDRYSPGGNSPELCMEYMNFSKSQLQEMLYLPEDRLAEVTPEMPVKEIRALKPKKEPEIDVENLGEVLDECKEDCEYQCNKSSLEKMKQESEPEVIDVEPEKVRYVNPVPRVEDLDQIKMYPESLTSMEATELEKEIKVCTEFLDTMAECYEAGVLSENVMVRNRTVKLACELLLAHGRPKEPKDVYDPANQPELPVLKNMDEREAFVDAYKTWPVWCKNGLTGETFYRYELPDKSAIVVRHHLRANQWRGKTEVYDCETYYLANSKTKYFQECLTNMTMLKEKLKNVQKDKGGKK